MPPSFGLLNAFGMPTTGRPVHLPSPANQRTSSVMAHSTDDISNVPLTQDSLPQWLCRNLLAARFTIYVAYVPAVVNLAFARLMSNDLVDDAFDFTCASNYIYHADKPWDNSSAPGHYHAQCRLLYRWAQVLTAACALALLRPFVQAIPIREPPSRAGQPPSRGLLPKCVYSLHAFSSAAIAVLYLVCEFILGTSRLITGPPTEYESYRPLFRACLATIVVSFLLAAHQAMAAAAAAWYHGRWRPRGREPKITMVGLGPSTAS
jgi:hypothetical protein